MLEKDDDLKDNFLWVNVILPLSIPRIYTYKLPGRFVADAKPGCRVEVVFGKNKKYAGIIKSVINTKPNFDTKTVLNLLDDVPILFAPQLKLWKWISDYYMCSEGEVMAAALPAHLKLSSELVMTLNDDYGDDFSELDDQEYLVAEALLLKKELHLSEIQMILEAHQVYVVIKRLVDKKVAIIWEAFNEKFISKKENYVLLNPEYDNEDKLEKLLNNWVRAPKQLELLLSYIHLYKTKGEVTQATLLKKSNATTLQLKGLIEKNIISIEKRIIGRIKSLPKKVNINFTLNYEQNIALKNIERIFNEKSVCLLHGVTSSGKTLIYVKLIEKILMEEKQVLYLLPEITLTAQIISRLQENFGGNIAIYHSKFNNNERVELWNKIKNGEVKILLGARSALFLPFKDLGLIIVDEEHDSSYKQQDPAPRYHARDAAIFLASLFKAKVLLGSATPSLESYYNALSNKYGLVELKQRYGGMSMPIIQIVDTRQVVSSKKGKVMISPQLKEVIESTVHSGQQVILFQNRRGYAPVLLCGTCGFIPRCNNCDVSLNLHKFTNKLHCHYCGNDYPKLIGCPACGTVNWIEKNFGTEKIEEELQDDFPGFRIARMDVDSVRGKSAHENLIKSFEQHKLDILAGTQMVVKGLDFEKVNLVGILDADGLLSFSDFRVNERAFQMMEQVSGRAGRKGAQGKVLIQAAKIDHPVLLFVKEHDYKRFYEFEILNRKQFFYPPFSRLILITLKCKVKEKVCEAAEILASNLKKDMHDYVIGPAAPVVGKIRNMYLMEIMIKLPKDMNLITKCKAIINNHFDLLHSMKDYKGVILVADVDGN